MSNLTLNGGSYFPLGWVLSKCHRTQNLLNLLQQEGSFLILFKA